MKTTAIILSTVFAASALASAQDVFDARPKVTIERESTKTTTSSSSSGSSIPSKAQRVRVNVGGIVEVWSAKTGADEPAFYLPPEGTRIAQMVIERKGGRVTYFVKGYRSGTTVGGLVARGLLDKEGFRPNNAADEARVQAMVRRNPVYIEVR